MSEILDIDPLKSVNPSLDRDSKELPEVDVIILSWNRIDMTIQTIQNILSQTGINPQIWVVDQGSAEASVEKLRTIASQYPNITLKPLGTNVGVPGGRNLGMEMGSSEYTVSIDNDAVFESSDALAKVVQAFETDEKLGAISFRINNFYTGDDEEYSWVYPQALKQKRDEQFLSTRYCGCGHAIRRSAFQKAGAYDASLFFCWEEIDLSYRLINSGYHLIYDPSIVVLHKCAPESRINWQDQRFYFTVRNAIYIYLKYTSERWKVSVLIGGYLVKGIYNKLPLKSFKGCVDGLNMYRIFLSENTLDWNIFNLNETSQKYLYTYELSYRGGFWDRVRNEVLTALPKTRTVSRANE